MPKVVVVDDRPRFRPSADDRRLPQLHATYDPTRADCWPPDLDPDDRAQGAAGEGWERSATPRESLMCR